MSLTLCCCTLKLCDVYYSGMQCVCTSVCSHTMRVVCSLTRCAVLHKNCAHTMHTFNYSVELFLLLSFLENFLTKTICHSPPLSFILFIRYAAHSELEFSLYLCMLFYSSFARFIYRLSPSVLVRKLKQD